MRNNPRHRNHQLSSSSAVNPIHIKIKPTNARKVEHKCRVVYIIVFSRVWWYVGFRIFQKGRSQSPFPRTSSVVNLLSLTVFPLDVSLAGSSAGTKRMWQRRRRETQSSLLCFITPFSMCLEGLLRGSWPRAEATGHSDILTPLLLPLQKQHPKILPATHLTRFTFLQPPHTQSRPAAHAPHRISDRVIHHPLGTNGL